MATGHGAVPTLPDARLLVDTELSILGATVARFDQYEQQIRDEYSFVPEATFRTKRDEILQSFLSRSRIFTTDYFFVQYEQPARANLVRSIERCVQRV